MKNILTTALLMAMLGSIGCSKLVEVKSPVTTFDADKVYNRDANAIATMTGIYQILAGDYEFAQGQNSLAMYAGLSADELVTYDGFNELTMAAYKNNFLPDKGTAPFWGRMYTYLYYCNAAIIGCGKSTTLTPEVKTRVIGEAKFMRAFLYFYLVNLWGDVPLITGTNYEENRMMAKSPAADVYKQIVADLKDAQEALTEEYLLSDLKTVTTERIRPNKQVATALLARVYLYTGEYALAETAATALLSQQARFDTVALSEAFLKNTKEAIWQFQAISPYVDTYEARAFIFDSIPNGGQWVSLSNFLLEDFEPGDRRRDEWVRETNSSQGHYYHAFKYKNKEPLQTEALTVFRISEQYLIRAEARAQASDFDGAMADLNVLRKRAGLAPLSVASKEDALDAVMQERRIELFSEWGHRWLDLKRTGRVDAVMAEVAPAKGATWAPYKAFYPIQGAELINAPNLEQTEGYN